MTVRHELHPTASPEELTAWVYLGSVVEGPAAALSDLIAEEGPVRAAQRLRTGAPLPPGLERRVSARRHTIAVEEIIAAARGVRARLLLPTDPQWPRQKLQAAMTAPGMLQRLQAGTTTAAEPVALWVRGSGSLELLSQPAVALVGTRGPSSYGLEQARAIAAHVAGAGLTVISGGAVGIDAAAHWGAVSAGGATIAVAACGVDREYPAQHPQLYQQIYAHGLVISEYPPLTPVGRQRFLARNRLTAALAEVTCVVEAGWRSGAVSTAWWAGDMGLTVMAVPGDIGRRTSAGCLRLLRGEGQAGQPFLRPVAELVSRPEDVVAAALPGEQIARIDVGPLPRHGVDELDVLSAAVFDAIDETPRSVTGIAAASGVPAEYVRRAIAGLYRAGLVTQAESGGIQRL